MPLYLINATVGAAFCAILAMVGEIVVRCR